MPITIVLLSIVCMGASRFALLVVALAVFPVVFGGWLPAAVSAGNLDFNYLDFLLFVLFIKHGWYLAWSAERRRMDVRLVVAALIFLFSLLFTTLWQFALGASHATLELVAFSRFCLLFGLFFVLMSSDLSEAQVSTLRKILLASGCICGLSIILQFLLARIGISFGYFLTYENTTGRYSGLIGDPNQAAAYLIFIFLYLYLRYGQSKSWAYVPALTIGAVCILLTGTRGPILALVLGLACIFMTEKEKLKGVLLALFGGMLLVAIASVVPSVGVVLSRSQGQVLEEGMTGRLQPVIRSMRIFLDHPVAGVGYSGHRFVAGAYSHGAEGNISGSYNQLMETAINGGLIALLAYAYFVVVAIQNLRMRANQSGELSGRSPPFIRATLFFFICIALFYQTDAWLLPASTVGYLTITLLALAQHRSGSSAAYRPQGRKLYENILR